MRLLLSVAWLFVLIAAPAAGQTPADPVPDAVIDRFMAALPHQEELTGPPPTDEQELTRLNGLNPGHEQEVRTIVQDFGTCIAPAVRVSTARNLRLIARDFGRAKLEKLIAFYNNADGRLFVQLSDASDAGRQLTDAEQRHIARMMTAYPLIDWANAIKTSGGLAMSDQAFILAVTKCSLEKKSALIKSGLQFR